MSRPYAPRFTYSGASNTRINGRIRAREVRVVGADGQQLGILGLGDALNLARSRGVDLVEVAPNATPPVCRLIDYGRYCYEQAKKTRESRKHHHAHKVKEIQLSASIDPHDFGVKLTHAIDFLCDEMKVKVTLRFRGREMAHKEFGFQVVQKFIQDVAPYGHPDAAPRLVGRGLTVMLSPLPRNKRAKNPRDSQPDGESAASPQRERPDAENDARPSEEFSNNPFDGLDWQDREKPASG